MGCWERIIPFFAFSLAVCKLIYTTNAIDSVNNVTRAVGAQLGTFSQRPGRR